MNVTEERYRAAIASLTQMHETALAERGAVDMIAGRNFVAYVILEPSGRYAAEVSCWGQRYGKVAFADTIEDLAHLVYAAFDAPD